MCYVLSVFAHVCRQCVCAIVSVLVELRTEPAHIDLDQNVNVSATMWPRSKAKNVCWVHLFSGIVLTTHEQAM